MSQKPEQHSLSVLHLVPEKSPKQAPPGVPPPLPEGAHVIVDISHVFEQQSPLLLQPCESAEHAPPGVPPPAEGAHVIVDISHLFEQHSASILQPSESAEQRHCPLAMSQLLEQQSKFAVQGPVVAEHAPVCALHVFCTKQAKTSIMRHASYRRLLVMVLSESNKIVQRGFYEAQIYLRETLCQVIRNKSFCRFAYDEDSRNVFFVQIQQNNEWHY